jgi:multiple sugar transport system permease protein
MSAIIPRSTQSRLASWRMRRIVQQAILYFLLSLVGVIILFPFYYMLISSLREPFYDFNQIGIDFLPSALNLAPFAKIFTSSIAGAQSGDVLLRGFINTMYLVVAIVGGSTFFNAMAAYIFAKHNFPGKQFFFTLLLLTIILPGEVTLVPKYVMFHRWGLLNTFWALILPSLTGVFGIFLMRQFMSTIPDALLEAARLDGASEFQVITKVVFPLSIPVLATYALFTYLGVWNDLIGPLLFVNKAGMWTLQLALYYFASTFSFQYGSAYGDATGMRMQVLFAGMIVTALPTILVFVIFQRQLVSGITLTGLKG